VESSCELGNEPSGSIKCWELPKGCTTCGLSSGTQLHRVSCLLQRYDWVVRVGFIWLRIATGARYRGTKLMNLGVRQSLA
jgi:hypothetical protein